MSNEFSTKKELKKSVINDEIGGDSLENRKINKAKNYECLQVTKQKYNPKKIEASKKKRSKLVKAFLILFIIVSISGTSVIYYDTYNSPEEIERRVNDDIIDEMISNWEPIEMKSISRRSDGMCNEFWDVYENYMPFVISLNPEITDDEAIDYLIRNGYISRDQREVLDDEVWEKQRRLVKRYMEQ